MTLPVHIKNLLFEGPRPALFGMGGIAGFCSGFVSEALRIPNPISSALKAIVTLSGALHIYQITSTEIGKKIVDLHSPVTCIGFALGGFVFGNVVGINLAREVKNLARSIVADIRNIVERDDPAQVYFATIQ